MTTHTIDTTNSAGCSPCTPEAHQRADVEARIACDLIDRALVLIGQVVGGEKNPVVLKTAADHLERAKRIINS